MSRLVLGAALGVFLLTGRAVAQPERFELGQRLRAFEAAFESADAAARRRALAPLHGAAGAFFAFRFGDAGQALDRARFAVLSADEPTPAAVWAATLYALPERRLADAAAAELAVELRWLYDPKVDPPAAARVRLTLLADGKPTKAVAKADIGPPPQTLKLPLAGVAEGDFELRCEVVVGGKVVAASEQTVSRAADLAARLERLQKAAGDDASTTDRATLAPLHELLAVLADRETLETNYPAARLLAEAEALAKAIEAGRRFYGPDRPGQFWLMLADGKRTAPARVLVPQAARKNRPLPLVVALHGAGGSENLFFDGHGRGKVVKLCEERGWLLAAPRAGLFGRDATVADLVDELALSYPVDRKRVFLVGHSLGAAMAVAAAAQAPERFAAVAALGGGGRPGRGAGLKQLPFFVGCGSDDFALPGTKSLAAALQNASAPVRTKVYDDVEHLAVVQVALPDVFAFFDEVAKSR